MLVVWVACICGSIWMMHLLAFWLFPNWSIKFSLKNFCFISQDKHVFQHPQPKRPKSLRIYESHVGMSSIVCFLHLSCATDFVECILRNGLFLSGLRCPNCLRPCIWIMQIIQRYHVEKFTRLIYLHSVN